MEAKTGTASLLELAAASRTKISPSVIRQTLYTLRALGSIAGTFLP